MKKIEINPTLQDWVDYLNENYQWANGTKITPRTIESFLRVSGYIEAKQEQDQ